MKQLNFLFLIALIFVATGLFAEEPETEKNPKRTWASTSTYKPQKGMKVGLFQLGGGFLLDLQDHVRGSATFAWTPTYQFNSKVSARWSIGFIYRNVTNKDELRVGDFSLTFIEKPKLNSPLYGELGGGVQYWTGDSSRKFYPEARAGFGYQFGDGEGVLKSFQLSYIYVLNTPLKTQQFLGVFTVGF